MAFSNQLPPLVEPPPAVVVEAEANSHFTHHSIETLVVVLAVITIVGVIAGIIARLCGGRDLGGHGDHDVEGWVERKCRSCIDSGFPTAPPPSPPLPPPPPPPPPPAQPAKEDPPKPPATDDAKK